MAFRARILFRLLMTLLTRNYDAKDCPAAVTSLLEVVFLITGCRFYPT